MSRGFSQQIIGQFGCRYKSVKNSNFEPESRLKDLEPDGSICVNLDIAQNAIGNHSCGPEPLEKYRLYPRKSKLNLRLVPYNKNECSEEEVYTLNTLII